MIMTCLVRQLVAQWTLEYKEGCFSKCGLGTSGVPGTLLGVPWDQNSFIILLRLYLPLYWALSHVNTKIAEADKRILLSSLKPSILKDIFRM